MPTCEQCGEEQFDCIDGLFYCSHCQTQSQHMRMEEEGEEFIDFMGFRPQSLGNTRQKQGKEQKKTEVDKGRLWVTHEAFQYIILEQVNTLIRLGAKPDIKEGVWRLWVLYLSQTGVAFTNTTEPPKKPLMMGLRPRHRDVQPGTLAIPVVKATRYRQSRKHSEGSSSLKKGKQFATVDAEEFYEGDNPESEKETEDEDDDELLFNDFSGEAEKCVAEPHPGKNLPRMKSTEERQNLHNPARMNLIKTLSFCYLGLLYTGSLSGPGDLTRWVKQGKLTYMTASVHLPDNMKFGTYDTKALSSKIVPTAARIRLEAYKIAKLLNLLDTLPKPDITLLIHRHIHTLELPADMHGLTANLLKKESLRMFTDPHHQKFTVQGISNYDAIAMSYVVITLKLLFGLDDSTERKLSTYACKLMEMVSLRQGLFVWEDWYQYQERAETERQGFFFLRCREDVREVRDVAKFTRQLREFSTMSSRRNENRRSSHLVKRRRPQTLDSLEQCFTLLGEKWAERNPNTTRTIDGPSAAATLIDHDPIGFLTDSPTKTAASETRASDKAFPHQKTDFRKTSLKFITQQEGFLEELDKQGLSDFTIYSSCVGSSSEGESHDQTDQSQDLFDDLSQKSDQVPAKRQQRRKRKRKKATEAVRSAVSQPSPSKPSKPLIKADLLENLARAYEEYALYKGKDTSEARHQSYDWLLRLCARLVDCGVDELDVMVQYLQQACVGSVKDKSYKLRSAIMLELFRQTSEED